MHLCNELKIFSAFKMLSKKIRMINIYESDFVIIKEIQIKNCKEIKFSNGGHLFAVANNTII